MRRAPRPTRPTSSCAARRRGGGRRARRGGDRGRGVSGRARRTQPNTPSRLASRTPSRLASKRRALLAVLVRRVAAEHDGGGGGRRARRGGDTREISRHERSARTQCRSWRAKRFGSDSRARHGAPRIRTSAAGELGPKTVRARGRQVRRGWPPSPARGTHRFADGRCASRRTSPSEPSRLRARRITRSRETLNIHRQ